jgi:ABC-type multidrug transport system fused ATPase/permease subunit
MYQSLIDDKIAFEQKKQKKSLFGTIFTTLNENIWELLMKLIIGYSIIQHWWSVWLMTMTLLYISQIRSFFYTIFSSKSNYEDTIDEFQRLELYLNMTTPKEIIIHEKHTLIDTITLQDISFAYPKISPEEIKSYEIMLNRLKKLWETNPSERIKDNIHFLQDAFAEADIQPVDVIKHISYTFEKWKIYGIVWQNGAWKTTLANILMWYFSNYTGDIYFNTTEQKNLQMTMHDTLFWVITQEPFIIYSYSIKQNILLWVEKQYSDQELQIYLEKFGLREKIAKLRKWLDSDLGYDADFSWWERQLLVLLRVILQDRPVLIIDEWTNQLDANNESLVMQELLKNKHNKIIIFITHRMTTIKKADTIICMENNTFSSIWSHNELITQKNIYTEFWNKQVVDKY